MKDPKIVEYKNLKKLIPKLTGKKVLVGGCFDFLHLGHIKFLRVAKKQGDKLIIALESDEFIRKKKKREPFHNQSARAEILSSLQMVDLVVLLPPFNSYNDYLKLVEVIKPDIVAVSENDPQIENKKSQVKKVGGRLIIVIPHISNIASSRLIKKLAELFF